MSAKRENVHTVANHEPTEYLSDKSQSARTISHSIPAICIQGTESHWTCATGATLRPASFNAAATRRSKPAVTRAILGKRSLPNGRLNKAKRPRPRFVPAMSWFNWGFGHSGAAGSRTSESRAGRSGLPAVRPAPTKNNAPAAPGWRRGSERGSRTLFFHHASERNFMVENRDSRITGEVWRKICQSAVVWPGIAVVNTIPKKDQNAKMQNAFSNRSGLP